MTIINLLQILLIIFSIVIISSKDNLKAVMFFSAFSLISASLYYFYKSPDLALAEAAIGSAILPMIFIISISKQKEFLVISHIDTEDPFFYSEEGSGYKILQEFTSYYDLKLVINKSNYDELHGIFREKNVDLVLEEGDQEGKYLLKGKKSSILMSKLEEMTRGNPVMEVMRIKEGEMYD